MDYNRRFTENAELLAVIPPASYTTEQNTGYVSCREYPRVVVMINVGTIGGDVDVDVEEGSDTSGSDAQQMNSGGKDLTIESADGANQFHVIEIKGEEFDVADDLDCLNIELTPGAATIFGVEVWGLSPRHEPVGTSNIDSVTD